VKSFRKYLSWLALAVFLIALPHFLGRGYYIHMLVMAGIYTILAISLNLIIGFSGQVSLCHAAFYGIGAYTSAIFAVNFGLSFWVTFWFGGLMAAIFSYLLGLMVLRLRGHFLAITTAFFGIFINLVINNWTALTKGPMGITGIPRPGAIPLPGMSIQISSRLSYYYLILVFLVFIVYVSYRIINSRIGKAMVAIRENEEVAQSIGVDAMKFKVIAFTLGGFFAGIAGSFYAHYILFISPVSFTLAESINVLVMVIFGGITTFAGPILGAILLTILPEFLRMAGDLRMTIYGGVLMLLIIFLPLGVFGTIKGKWVSIRG